MQLFGDDLELRDLPLDFIGQSIDLELLLDDGGGEVVVGKGEEFVLVLPGLEGGLLGLEGGEEREVLVLQ